VAILVEHGTMIEMRYYRHCTLPKRGAGRSRFEQDERYRITSRVAKHAVVVMSDAEPARGVRRRRVSTTPNVVIPVSFDEPRRPPLLSQIG
jgi:hypothetical protein